GLLAPPSRLKDGNTRRHVEQLEVFRDTSTPEPKYYVRCLAMTFKRGPNGEALGVWKNSIYEPPLKYVPGREVMRKIKDATAKPAAGATPRAGQPKAMTALDALKRYAEALKLSPKDPDGTVIDFLRQLNAADGT